MARFHPLEVTDIRKETRDAVVVTLKPREEDRAAFAFTQGQYLTFRREFDGDELRRSYSICTGLDEGCLKVGIKRVDGGAFSTWANEELKVGEVLDAMPPQGRFFTALEPDKARHYLGFAGGSGITPVLSIIKTVLSREPRSSFTLVYANRQVGSIMFREELEDLKNLHLGRFSVIHVLETEWQEIDLFSGRIDAGKMETLFRLWIDAESVDTAFICGPEPMMLTIAESLRSHGLTDRQIKFELFASSQPGRAKKRAVSEKSAAAGNSCEVSVTLDGATRTFRMPKDGTAILDAAIGNDIDAPYSCKSGVCSTCRARVLEGEVEMEINHALEDYEVRAGYVLSCQCIPLSDKVVLSYDE
ncbi:1,2-phenylacetyl-CoA epoxidase subunit PaaE [Ostreiculturibacter nitratireducens]|uniref:1,2-phenylacetyl-CoA epoxidase subunit PaaE n=1 Tax=Ostreiculturibacter nitratireducens TaxID=3075226 RepID=UPI0031B5E481